MRYLNTAQTISCAITGKYQTYTLLFLFFPNLAPCTELQEGWQTDFSWQNLPFDISMAQERRCKNFFPLLFYMNTLECQADRRAGREAACMCLSSSFNLFYSRILPVTTDYFSVTPFL